LVRPTGSSTKPDEAAVQKLIQDLSGAGGNLQQLWNVVRQTAHYDLFKEAGVPQRDVVAALRCLELNLTANNPKALLQLERATADLDKLLAKVKQAPLRKALRKAAADVTRALEGKLESAVGLDNARQAKQQVLKGIQAASAYVDHHDAEMAKRMELSERIVDEARQSVEDVVQLIPTGFAPPAQGIDSQFDVLKSRLQGIKSECNEEFPSIKFGFKEGSPPADDISRFGLEKQLSDAESRIGKLQKDVEAKLNRCEQWIEQARQAAAGAIARQLEATAVLEKLLATKIQRITAGPWTTITQTVRNMEASIKRADSILEGLRGSYLP
jgi:predicted  nucleic acid-binding Zn-ribbon protein